jgi:hypothetical protein
MILFDPLFRIACLARQAQECRRAGNTKHAAKLTREAESVAAQVLKAGPGAIFDQDPTDVRELIDEHIKLCELLKNALRGEREKEGKPPMIDRVEDAIHTFYLANDRWPSNKDLRGLVTTRDLAEYQDTLGKRSKLVLLKIGTKKIKKTAIMK